MEARTFVIPWPDPGHRLPLEEVARDLLEGGAELLTDNVDVLGSVDLPDTCKFYPFEIPDLDLVGSCQFR